MKTMGAGDGEVGQEGQGMIEGMGGRTMRGLLAVAATLAVGCAPAGMIQDQTIPITAVSHNRSPVDVYLLCGDHDAEWLGVVSGKETGLFEIPAARARCVEGLNFFLVPRNGKRGYWVGPLFPQRGWSLGLTIEKYAGLSTARVR
jgi:hypothetical protein